MQDVINNNRHIIYITFIVAVVCSLIYIIFLQIILGGVSPTNLKVVSPLEAAINKNSSDSSVVIEGETYFIDKTWAVVTTHYSEGSAYIVLQKTDGFWNIVLGPGTSFSTTDTQEIPIEVSEYLQNPKDSN